MENKYDEVMSRIEFYYVDEEPYLMNEESLLLLEQQLAYPLPTDYRQFLQKYGITAGGGDVCYTNADDPNEVESSVEVFYGIKPGDSYDLLERKRGFGDRLPIRILPIASSPGGEFCLSLAGNDIGNVYWWDSHGGSRDSDENLEFVARDFDSFLTGLIVAEIE